MNSDHPSDTIANEFVEHYQWLSSLRPEVREQVLKFWDHTGRPVVDDPITALLIELAKLNVDRGYDAFATDATNTLVRFRFVEAQDLKRHYMLFMAGAIWGTITVQNMISDNFRNQPSSNNP